MERSNLYERLYSKTVTGGVKTWYIASITEAYVHIRYGAVGGKMAKSAITAKNTDREATKRWKDKYNKGYRTLEQMKAQITDRCEVSNIIKSEVLRCLPDIQLDENQVFKSMLCQKFKFDKFNYPALAQPKINGLRATESKAVIIGNAGTMFEEKELIAKFLSREGKRYVLNHLNDKFAYRFGIIPDTMNFDGELYIPDAPLNVIKSAVPYVNDKGTISRSNSNTNKVQYWMFDLAIPVSSQLERNGELYQQCQKMLDIVEVLPKDPYEAMEVARYHLERGNKFIFMLTGTMVHSDEEFIKYKEECIAAGFEGAVLRDLEAEYAFGQRPKTMVKLKQFKHTECEILDIIVKDLDSMEDKLDLLPREVRGILADGCVSEATRKELIKVYANTNELSINPAKVKFILRNDINDAIFDCTPEATFPKRIELLLNKEDYIGKLATVRFFERSGVEKVPFHANVEAWDRAGSGDLNPNDLSKE